MAPDLSDPKIINADDIADGVLDPNFNWDRAIPAPGHTNVDFEERVNFRRLHNYRLGRTRQALVRSDLGALLDQAVRLGGGPGIGIDIFDAGSTPDSAVTAARTAVDSGAQMLVGPVFGAQAQAVSRAVGSRVPVVTLSNDASLASRSPVSASTSTTARWATSAPVGSWTPTRGWARTPRRTSWATTSASTAPQPPQRRQRSTSSATSDPEAVEPVLVRQ